MQDQPHTPPEPRALRQLRVMVTTLTGVMIFGIIAIVVLLALRLHRDDGVRLPPLPATVTLPAGVTAIAVTAGPGWYAVVTSDDRILVYDATRGTLRQDIPLDTGRE
jgi:uncharacterized integral membrane protein